MIAVAVKETAEAIADGTAPAEAITMYAEEHGLNPVLLRRKFVEQFKVEPEAYAGKVAAAAEFKEVAAKGVAEAKEKEALSIAKEVAAIDGFFGLTDFARTQIGKRFEYSGEAYIVAGFVRGRTYVMKAVRVADGTTWRFNRHTAARVLAS